MKSTIKITSSLAAIAIVLLLLNCVIAINNLKVWSDRYVAISMMEYEPGKYPAIATSKKAIATFKDRPVGKLIASKAIGVMIKEITPDYASMTARQLKSLCKGTGIKGWEKLRKAELISALSEI